MHKKEKSKGKAYDRSFFVFIAVIVGITGMILLINDYSSISGKSLVEESNRHMNEAEIALEKLQEQFNQYGSILEKLGETENDWRTLEEEINVLMNQFLSGNNLVTGVFFELFQEDGLILCEGFSEQAAIMKRTGGYFTEFQGREQGYQKYIPREKKEESFLYMRPVFFEKKYIGYMGMLISKEAIGAFVDKTRGEETWSYIVFLEKEAADLNILEDSVMEEIEKKKEKEGYIASTGLNGKQVYTFQRLSGGLIYIEIYAGVKRVQQSNKMILLIGFFAIVAMWMIQENKKTGKNFFMVSSDFVMKGYIDNINSVKRQGNRGIIALNIGMATAVFADVIYSIVLRREVRTIIEYTVFLFMAVGIIFLYKKSKNGITEKIGTIIIIAGLLGPLSEHLLAGGFSTTRAGESHLWFIICLYIGLFILGTKKAINVFNAFVVLMFFNVVVELILFGHTNYEGIFLFAISFILLGFALFVSMEVYVSGAASHYFQTEELIKRLNEDQSLLLQKEKLSALGQLISGVAHEINTPLGAIKASAETMDGMFLNIIKEVLDGAKQFSEEEYQCFLRMVDLTFSSMSKMQTTLEVRTSKKLIKKYFEGINLERKEEIVSYLGQLEIVDLEIIQENISLFQMENIDKILNKTKKLTSFTSGIPTTIYAADRMTQIVLALKSYVHTSALGEMIEFDVIKSIENVLILYRNQLKSNIEIIKKYEKKECLIIGNPDELAQVWTNLIQNAIQAMKEGGNLTIEVGESENEMVVIMIGDTGDGISSQWLEKIYDPFFTTKERGEGSGLGLNISKKVIEKHHGKLKVESQLGKGTKFYINLRKNGG